MGSFCNFMVPQLLTMATPARLLAWPVQDLPDRSSAVAFAVGHHAGAMHPPPLARKNWRKELGSFRNSLLQLIKVSQMPKADFVRVHFPDHSSRREDTWRPLILYLLSGFRPLALTVSANSIRRRIASEREGLSFCCLA